MGIDVAHLVLEALGDADDQVVDDSPHRPEGSDILAGAVVDLDADDILLGPREADGDVAKVLGELPCFLQLETKFPSISHRTTSSGVRRWGVFVLECMGWHTSRALDRDDPRLDVDADCNEEKNELAVALETGAVKKPIPSLLRVSISGYSAPRPVVVPQALGNREFPGSPQSNN